ncbi:NAD-dependent epimerase/dehydratase family protein [Xenorhabdus innexi]|uniref:Paratose synthase n=1 Tax=Xenorhabdus innexi TaxID=290109 RepID=A0A1N6MTZ6_9GAMM|nr:NAD(P)-dependent oxidoreductase [Xenorhabdus innexi]PHM33404.1 paratose synthase [Xenorhabdus innexi]SIP72281.1 TDP-glucose-4,6-dehydratase-related protein [Xenorhabdus innexi]
MSKRTILLTGASGRIGQTFFLAMQEHYIFTLVDQKYPDYPISDPHHFILADLSDPTVIEELVSDVENIIHLAGIPHANAVFEDLLPANILTTTYLLQAAAKLQCRRFVFASSAQTIEGYPVDKQIPDGAAVSPANIYGATKCYGEALCSYFASQKGLSSVAIRIGAFEFKENHSLKTARDLSAWLSPDDAVQLLTCAIETEEITFFIAHGISDNRFKRLDLTETRKVLGYTPKDDAFRTFDLTSFEH